MDQSGFILKFCTKSFRFFYNEKDPHDTMPSCNFSGKVKKGFWYYYKGT